MMLQWFIGGAIAATILVFVRKDLDFHSVLKKHWKHGLILGVTNALAALGWSSGMFLIGPNLLAFIWRLGTLFIILLGVLFLKERLSKVEILGAGLAVAGTVVLSYTNGNGSGLWILLPVMGALAAALHHFASKMFVKDTHPLVLVQMRVIFSLLSISLGVGLVTTLFDSVEFIWLPLHLLPLIFFTGILTAIVSFYLFFKAYEHLDVSKTAVIRTIDPFIVILYVFFIFRELPTEKDVVGGFMIVIGVLISVAHHRVSNQLKQIWKLRSWI